MILHQHTDRVRYTLSHEIEPSLIILEPDGWQDDGKELARNETYEGIFTKFSNNLVFKGKAAIYINKIKDTYGKDSPIRLLREERHPTTDVWTDSYDGFLDLFKWAEDKNGVKAKFNASGLEKTLKAKRNKKVEIERLTDLYGNTLPELPTHTIEDSGRKVFLLSNLEGNNLVTIQTYISSVGDYKQSTIAFPMIVKTDSDDLVVTPFPQVFNGVYASHNASGTDMFYLDNDRLKVVKVKIKLSFLLEVENLFRPHDSNQFITLNINKYNNSTALDYVESFEVYTDPTPLSVSSRRIDIDHEVSITLDVGESLSFAISTGGTFGSTVLGIGARGYYIHNYSQINGFLQVEENSYFPSTSLKIVTAHEKAARLIQIITGKTDAFHSPILGRTELGYPSDGLHAFKGYTCGHWNRGFSRLPVNDENKYKPYTTSFKDLMDDLLVTDGLGLEIVKVGFKEQIVIRDARDFYLPSITIRLGQVSNVKRKTIEKKGFSDVLIGYEKGWENEEAMGLDETNAQSEYSLPLDTQDENIFKKVSKYIYGSYPREFSRRKPIASFPTEDHRLDKNIFGLALKRFQNTFALKYWQDDLAQAPTGIYAPETATNLLYSPFNLLLKHAWYFKSGLTKKLNQYLRFTSGEGNTNLTTQKTGEAEYQEKQDILISSLDKALFIDEEITFNYEVDFLLLKEIEGYSLIDGKKVRNFYGRIEFVNEKNVKETGYFKSLKPNNNEFKLIKSNF